MPLTIGSYCKSGSPGKYICVTSRLVTQMYFPGDPLMQYDPMITGTPERYRNRLIADFSLDITEEGYALGYQFDIVLRGADETPFENR